MNKPFGWLSRPSAALPRGFDEPRTADSVLRRQLLWRRRVLILVVVLTALTAVIDTSTELIGGSRLAFHSIVWLEPETAPPQQTMFGDLADLAWLLSFYAMPAAALLAAVFWAQPRRSRAILLAGWATSFLVPVAIALTPWDWWTATLPPAATPEVRLARQHDRVVEGLVWGNYYVLILSPAVLALVPACCEPAFASSSSCRSLSCPAGSWWRPPRSTVCSFSCSSWR